MWSEAKRQEKALRDMMVDYKKRAERRKEFYEKMKQDPAQFLQLHGRSLKIHLDPAIAQAAEAKENMMPWQGHKDITIDRFDGRAHLDYIPEPPARVEEDLPFEAGCSSLRETCDLNYERYRIIVQNDFLNITEEKFLRTIEMEEKFGGQTYVGKKAKEDKKKLKDTKAAIGFVYEDSTTGGGDPTGAAIGGGLLNLPDAPSPPPSATAGAGAVPGEDEENEDDDDSGSDLDLDLSVDLMSMGMEGQREINKTARSYALGREDFVRYMARDIEEREAIKAEKQKEEERAAKPGKKSRRDRRQIGQRARGLATRRFSPPRFANFATRSSPTYDDFYEPSFREERSSGSNSSDDDDGGRGRGRGRSKRETGKVEFITSFGGDSEEETAPDLTLGKAVGGAAAARLKRLKRDAENGSPPPAIIGPAPMKKPVEREENDENENGDKKTRFKSRKKKSPSRSSNKDKDKDRKKQKSKSRSKSRSRSPGRRVRKRNRSPSTSSSSSSEEEESKKATRYRSKYRNRRRRSSSSSSNRSDRDHGRRRRRDRDDRRRSRSRSRRRRRSRSTSYSSEEERRRRRRRRRRSTSSSSSASSSRGGRRRGRRRSRSPKDSSEAAPRKNYYASIRQRVKDKSESDLSGMEEDEGSPGKSSTPPASRNSGVSSAHGRDPRDEPRPSASSSSFNKMKKRMQAQIKRHFKIDKLAEEERKRKQEEEQFFREEELRELSIKLRRREREKREKEEMEAREAAEGSEDGGAASCGSDREPGSIRRRSRSRSKSKSKSRRSRSRSRSKSRRRKRSGSREHRDRKEESPRRKRHRSRSRSRSRSPRRRRRSRSRSGSRRPRRSRSRSRDRRGGGRSRRSESPAPRLKLVDY